MGFIKRHLIIILTIIILAGLFVLYQMFFRDNFASNGLLATEAGSAAIASGAGQELLALLEQLRAIELDRSVFTDSVFENLQDFRSELLPEPVGRPDPFAPLGQ